MNRRQVLASIPLLVGAAAFAGTFIPPVVAAGTLSEDLVVDGKFEFGGPYWVGYDLGNELVISSAPPTPRLGENP